MYCLYPIPIDIEYVEDKQVPTTRYASLHPPLQAKRDSASTFFEMFCNALVLFQYLCVLGIQGSGKHLF